MKLRYSDKELSVGEGVTSIGRSSDNAVSFPDDSNVSRYHAEIELRGEEFCLIDLSSSNGTAVNGTKVSGEIYLTPGDVIVLGGTSSIIFGEVSEAGPAVTEPAAVAGSPDLSSGSAASAVDAASLNAALEANTAGGSNKMLLLAGAICCIAILFVAGAAAVYYFALSSSCDASAGFITPDQGENITQPTDVEISVKNEGCVAKAVFTVDGKPFASIEEPPFTASIDPKNFPELADGVDHLLGLILIDSDGNQLPQAGGVMIAFDTSRVTPPDDNRPEIPVGGTQQPSAGDSAALSLIDIQKMTNALAVRLAGGRSYNVSNQQFLKEVQKKAAEYTQAGFFAKASKYRDAINVAYAREQNLDASLGYILAMSRSRFDPAKQPGGEGLWRMSTELVTSNGYNGQCGSEPIGDVSQNCAAKASALYVKALVFSVFDGDMIYSAAAFGKSPAEAGAWKASLPANRTDVWNAIRTAPEREQLVRFFAAGIVAENPQKFGLKNDRPISDLYRLTM